MIAEQAIALKNVRKHICFAAVAITLLSYLESGSQPTKMNWVVKTALQKVIGMMPAIVGDPVYHGLQRTYRGIPSDIEGQRAFVLEVTEFLQAIRGTSIPGMRIIELGSGWYPTLPLLLLREFGAAQIYTFDSSRHYSRARIGDAAREIMKAFPESREDPVLQATASTGVLPESVHYYPHRKLQEIAGLPDGPADLAVSRSVLEYMVPQDVALVHRQSHKWLKKNALWVHLVGTSDDRARHDRSLKRFDFLRYGEAEWTRICGNRYSYKNQLRLPEYRDLFKLAGWNVARERAVVSESAIADLKLITIHSQFAKFSASELVAGAIRFALESSTP
jgi:hypothetical protein